MTVKTKRFRIGVEGATTDGREIQREWLEQMAASYNPAVYTALINLEQLLGLGVGSTIAGTTDTTAKEREPVDPTLMVDVEYKCEQTNFDTVLTYAKLDLWAKFQDFQVRIRDAIVKRQAYSQQFSGIFIDQRALQPVPEH